MFDTTGKVQFNLKTFDFDANRPVKRLQAKNNSSHGAYRITFLAKTVKKSIVSTQATLQEEEQYKKLEKKTKSLSGYSKKTKI